jgi:hypothetical protein
MNSAYVDVRAGRDVVASGAGILLLTTLLILIAAWYVKPRRAIPVPPPPCRVMYIREGADRTALAPIHFSLPSKIGFSRTVQPGDPRVATTLGPRTEDIRYLPREAGPENVIPIQGTASAPLFRPWSDETPVFAPVPAGPLTWKVVVEPQEGMGCVLPPGLAEEAQGLAPGAWSAMMRLQAGPDGRVTHVFLLPPVPENGVGARLESLMRKTRLEGGARECRVKISRVELPAGPAGEGTKP